MSDLICRLKYADQPQLSKALATFFVTQLRENDIALPEALISVPMHPKKLRERGYNQSTELAKQLGRQLDLPVLTGFLRKHKTTERQATQTLKQRKNNVKGSFSSIKTVPYSHVAIVDDVVTTGATAEEIAKTLKKIGVDYIQVWGLARTL